MSEPPSYVADWLKQADPDRYLACLFAPEHFQPDLMALYAFNADIAAIRERVKDALPAEMRLEWWREALQGAGRGAASNPLSVALLAAIPRRKLPLEPLLALVDARTHDLYDDLFATTNDLIGYCGETSSSLLRLAGIILMDGSDPNGADAFGHAGVAYALTGLLRAFPYHVAQGRLMWPQDLLAAHGLNRGDILAQQHSAGLMDAWHVLIALAQTHLDAAEKALPTVDPNAKLALLPLALVRPELKMLRRINHPYEMRAPTARWRTIWRLWRGAQRLT